MVDLTQVFAWSRMFAGHSRAESFAAAARDTFDPGKSCEICRVVSEARDASGQRGPAVPSAGCDRMVLIVDRSVVVVAAVAKRTWKRVSAVSGAVGAADVPVPPPRG
jgi:hypothetical protein